jgi:hypothetical protein
MNTWNSEFVRSAFEKQYIGFITNVDGKVELQQPAVANEIRRLVRVEGASPNSSHTVQKSFKTVRAQGNEIAFPYKSPTFGYVVEWLSELGKDVELDGLLAYADSNLHPTWENGGLYYPRNDQLVDGEGKWKHMDPFSGNAAIGYARLNVEDGQKEMWDQPWSKGDLAAQPWVDGLDLSQNVDCLRGVWDKGREAIIVTLRAWSERTTKVDFYVRNLGGGSWAEYNRDQLQVLHKLPGSGDIRVERTIRGGEEIDVVIVKEQNT